MGVLRRGYYPWWLLEDSLDLTTPRRPGVGADMSAKPYQVIADTAADLQLVLLGRDQGYEPGPCVIPGTINWKVKDDP